MIKLFKAINIEGIEQQINKFLIEHPNYHVTSISHCDIGTAQRIGLYQWSALISYKIME